MRLTLCLRDFFNFRYNGVDELQDNYVRSQKKRETSIFQLALADKLYQYDAGRSTYNATNFEAVQIEMYKILFDLSIAPGQTSESVWAEIGKELSLTHIRESEPYRSLVESRTAGAPVKLLSQHRKRKMLFSHIINSLEIVKIGRQSCNLQVFRLLALNDNSVDENGNEIHSPIKICTDMAASAMDVHREALSDLFPHYQSPTLGPQHHEIYRVWAFGYAELHRPWDEVRKSLR